MQWKYKAVMFLTLLIFCVGSVCATEPNNTTHTNLTDNQKVDNGLDTIITTCNLLKEDNAKQAIEIQNLKDNNTQLDKRVKALEDSNNQLNNTVNNQNVIINSLKDDNKVLTDSNKVLTDRVQALEYSKLTQSNRIKALEIDIKNLEDSNKQLINSNKQLIDSNKDLNVKIDNQNSIINELNNTVNNQNVIINSLKTDNEALNAKLDLQLIEIKELQADKDKLNAEIKQTYEKLLNSPKKEDFDQLKKEIDNKNKQIDKLNNEINTLRAIISVNGKDVYNSLKDLSSTKNIKCGKYTFKLEDYLKIPLIKDGKNRVIKYKKKHGRLPNYVTIAGYEVPKNVYQKLYNL